MANLNKIVNIIGLSQNDQKIVDYLANGPCYFFDICCKIVKKDSVSQVPSGFLNKKMQLLTVGDVDEDLLLEQSELLNVKVNTNNRIFNKNLLIEFDDGMYFMDLFSKLHTNFENCEFLNIGVFKAYKVDKEQNTILPLDLVAIKEECKKNLITNLAITKIDTLFRSFDFKVCVKYSDEGFVYKHFKGDPLHDFSKKTAKHLSHNINHFLNFLEEYLELPVSLVSYGKKRQEIVSFLPLI